MTQLADLPLWKRLEIARTELDPVRSTRRIVFEADIDSPAAVLVPDPNWMACALHGGILPPVEVYHNLHVDDDGRVTNGHILHETAPVGAMTEDEAIDYLLRKDIPTRVWSDLRRNRPQFMLTTADRIPRNRLHRNAWGLNLDPESPISVEFDKAKYLQRKRLVDFFIGSDKRCKEIEPYTRFDEDLEREFTTLNSMRPELSFDRLDRAKTLEDLDAALPAPLVSQFYSQETH